jgi:hypothetical protein
MADRNMPNMASRKSKAEEERWTEGEDAGARERSGYVTTDEQAGGITNRPLGEEIENQEALPERGEARPGAHAGHGDKSPQSRNEP